MRFKKVLSLVLAMVMVVTLMPTTAMATAGTGSGNPQLTKNAEWVDQKSGLAKIILEAKGKPIVTSKKGADVVVVMDYSGSMGMCNEKVVWTYYDSYSTLFYDYDVYTGICPNGHTHRTEVRHGRQPKELICEENLPAEKTRWVASKNALDTLLNQIIPTSGSENQVALVAFDSDVETNYTKEFTKNKQSIMSTINRLSVPYPGSSKGTNYTSALQKAKDYINSRSDKSRDAYVVFLSDGEPDNGYEGTSQIQAIKSIKGVTVYTIGLALNSASAINRLQGYASKPEFFKNISTAGDLDGIFEDIGQTIASEVTVLDTIDTQYFSVAEKPGANVSYEASKGTVQFSNDKDFVWNLENFSENGETLEIYIQLKAEYLNKNAAYPTNAKDSAYGRYIGEDGTNVPLYVTENSVSSAVPKLTTTAVPTYSVTGTITNGNGTVTNGNQPNVSTSLEMVFTANPGYHIASITRNGTPYSLTGITTSYIYPAGAVTENVVVNVTTAENSNAVITYITSAIGMGTVTPPSNSVAPATGSATGSTATPKPGFHFVNWTVGGAVAGTDAILTPAQVNAFAKNSDGIYVATEFTANFAENSEVTINYVAVGGGSVNKDGESLAQSTSEPLKPSSGKAKGATATANKGYKFIGWATTDKPKTEEDWIIKGKPPLKGDILENQNKINGVWQTATYYAIFAESDVTMTYKYGDGGTVSRKDETFKAKNQSPNGSTAIPDTGYHFVDWRTESGDLLASGLGNETYVPQPDANGVYESATYYASFAKDVYSVSGSMENGEVTIKDQKKEYGSQSDPMEFTANEGYHITSIKVNNVEQSLDGITTSYTYPAQTVTGTITVDVKAEINKYVVVGKIDNGTVLNESQNVNHGSSSTAMEFTAKEGYHITSIKVNNVEQSLDGITTSYTYPAQTVTKAITVEVTTEINKYAVTGTIDNDGTVSNYSQNVSHGSASAAMVFEAAKGYHITGIKVNDVAQPLDGITTSYTYPAQTVTKKVSVVVTTGESDVTMTYGKGVGGTVSPPTETFKAKNESPNGSTAIPDTGYHFVDWRTESGDLLASGLGNETYVPQPDANGVYESATYYASFAKDVYSVSGSMENGEVTIKDQKKEYGSQSDPMEFTANEGYHITSIKVNNVEQSLDGITTSYTYPAQTVTGTITVEVKAEINKYVVVGKIDNGTVLNESQNVNHGSLSTAMEFTAKEGYHITSIKVNNVEQSLDGITTSYTYPAQTVTGTITVEVKAEINKYAVVGKIDNGTVLNESQNVNHGSLSDEMVFEAKEGYQITSIKVNDVSQPLDGITRSYAYPAQTVTGPISVVLTTAINEYAVTGTIDNGEVTNESQNVSHGSLSDEMAFKANEGYHITGATVDGNPITLPAGITTAWTYPAQTVTKAISVVVTTAINKYAVTGTIDNGEVTNDIQNVEHGTDAKEMEFTAAPGYKITGATVNGTTVTIPAETTDTWAYTAKEVTGTTVVAVTTEEDDVEILYEAGDGGTVTRDKETVKAINGVPQGSTAEPNPGFRFVKWTFIEGVEVGTDKTLVPSKENGKVYIGGTYTAVFAEDEEVTIYYKTSEGGSISSESEALLPATGVATGSTATAYAGYNFFNWTNSSGDVVSTSKEFKPIKLQGIYVADTYTANFKPKYHNFVVEDIYQNLIGEKVDELHSVTGKDPSEKVAFNSEISSTKNEYLRGYEYSDMLIYVDEEIASDEELLALGITVDRISGTLTGNLPDHQIWVKYIYNEVEKFRVDYTSEGNVTGIPTPITDAIQGEEITISTAVPARNGFDFLEWIPQINGDQIQVTDGKFMMPEGNVEIRATWKANAEIFNYNVKYYTEDGKLIATIPSTVLKSDPIVTSVENKAPEGYKLQGYTFNGGEMSRELSAEITENGQTISVYYEKNDLIVKHVYGATTVYDSNQSKANLSIEIGNVIVKAVTSGRYTRITGATLNNSSLGSVTAVTVVPNGETKYEVVFTYGTRSSDSDDDNTYTPSNPGSSDDTPGEEVTIIEDPAVALQDGLETIDHFAYVFGYEDGTVRPENKVTREEVATIFYRLLTDGTRDALFTKEQDFPDVSSGRWSNVAIATLLNGKIVSGYPDGEFKPGNYITRAEFAAIVAKFDNLSYSGDNKFSDVYAHWAANYINSAAIKGWINGYPDGTFHPDAYISRAEAITLINAVLGRQVSKEGLLPEAKYWSDNTADKWYYEAVMEATNSHDYERATDSNIEKWTELKEDKIWTER